VSDLPEYPRTYKEQRLLEKRCARARADQTANGMDLPQACGFTYIPRKPTQAKPDWKPTPAVCWRNAGEGTNHYGNGYCDYHEVQAKREPQNKTAQIKVAQKVASDRALFFGKPRNIDPHTALLEEIQRTASIVNWLEDHLQKLDEEGRPVDEILTQTTLKEGMKPSVWMDLFLKERQHLVSTCVAAIKAGVAERKVQIAEQTGRLIAAMMMAFMHDSELGLDPDQLQRAPALIRKHLMALPQAATQNELDPEGILAVHQKVPKGVRIIETGATG